ncbi:probable receptor-like serine/threonine-protein kinase, partial [Tanacetum coccineum]
MGANKQQPQQIIVKSNESAGGGSTATSASVGSGEGNNNNNGDMGWGRWYGIKELEIATSNFAVENVIGEGGYGVVYRGVVRDGSVVAVKNLLNN